MRTKSAEKIKNKQSFAPTTTSNLEMAIQSTLVTSIPGSLLQPPMVVQTPIAPQTGLFDLSSQPLQATQTNPEVCIKSAAPITSTTKNEVLSEHTPKSLCSLLNLLLTSPLKKATVAVASATQTVPTVVSINISGTLNQTEEPTLVDLTNSESTTEFAKTVSASQISSMSYDSNQITEVTKTSLMSGTNVKTPTVLPVVEAPLNVVVKQQETVKPYNGSTSYRAYRDYFERVCKINNWVTNLDKAQHLSLALEGPAVELLKEVAEDQPDLYEQIWAAIARRFGYLDEPERAMQRFDSRRQGNGETVAVYEQALRTIHREAWPNANAQTKDSALKRRFIAGLANPEMQQFLRSHAKTDDFANTVAKARQFQDAHELAKVKKPNIRMAENRNHSSDNQIQPVLDGLQRVLETVFGKQPSNVRYAQVNSESRSENKNRKTNGQNTRSQSPAASETSRSSNGSNNSRAKSIRFSEQSNGDRNPPRQNGSHRDSGNNSRFQSTSPRQNQNQNQNNGDRNSRNWDRNSDHRDFRNRSHEQSWNRNREQSPGQFSLGSRIFDRGRPHYQRSDQRSNEWPTDRSSFPWRSRTSSADSSLSTDRRGLTQRRWDNPAFSGPRQQRNYYNPNSERERPPIGCYVCGLPGCHSQFHRRNGQVTPRPTESGCFVCGQVGCH